MSRRKSAIRRPVPADPRYDSQTVSKFLNNLMERGKKSLSERIFYQAMDLIEQRTGQPGVNVFKQALSNVKPALEVKSRGVNVCALCPGFTYTEFHDANGMRATVSKLPKWLWQDSPTVARLGVEAVEAGRTRVVRARQGCFE